MHPMTKPQAHLIFRNKNEELSTKEIKKPVSSIEDIYTTFKQIKPDELIHRLEITNQSTGGPIETMVFEFATYLKSK